MAAGLAEKPHRECRTICLPVSEDGGHKRCQERMALSTGILHFGERKFRRPRSVEERDPSRS